ncbi:MAG TPA: macrolide ABC transporter ATP-binding protein [Phycisphaerales bacterium]|nr:MAG: macrolide ABC transporter ATP-binding protein [Planctomycetes bacterium GWC2_45_44]HBG78162.1 macrolide ABC transporter ATP-binding protein [Phycisphaerales bacterium]HBR19042.1 macrolide ABC transporter ATP-binding protein [Phycisphaerales bacterium]
MSIVQFENIHKHYQMGSEQVLALNGVSLSFDKGSFWAIMGPSGSGKSTMMNILGCLDRPTSGEYLLEDKNVGVLDDNSLSDIRLKYIGFVFQSFNLMPQLSVQKNIELPLYYLGWEADKSAERAKELAEKVGLSERLNHKPAELSGGQMQRVAVARSLAAQPHIILADEPTGNLDSHTGEQIMRLLTELNAEGTTIIMVTHEPDIAGYAKNRLHMKDGKVEKIE